VSRLFLDHGTRVEVSRTTFLVSKCLETGTEVFQSVLMPKCLVAEVSGNLFTLRVVHKLQAGCSDAGTQRDTVPSFSGRKESLPLFC